MDICTQTAEQIRDRMVRANEREVLRSVFMRDRGVSATRSYQGLERVVGKRRGWRSEVPRIDHGEVFSPSGLNRIYQGSNYVYTGQPYPGAWEWSDKKADQILGYGLNHGCALQIYFWDEKDPANPGWHYPGVCHFILVTNAFYRNTAGLPEPYRPEWFSKAVGAMRLLVPAEYWYGR